MDKAWTESDWHYVSIRYGDHLLGILIETDDAEEACREGAEICGVFGEHAAVIDVRKVVLQ